MAPNFGHARSASATESASAAFDQDQGLARRREHDDLWRISMNNNLKIDGGEWVVVCDGARALVLENVGDRKYPDLRTKEVYKHEAAPTSELGADKPGRAFSSVGSGRSAVQQTDWHDQEEQRFLASLS